MPDEFDIDDQWFRFRQKTKSVTGGIKAQTKKFGESWWAQRWLSTLESFGYKSRLARGRSYARKGQIIDLHIEPGKVSAKVQGSRNEPYQIQVQFQPIPSEARLRILDELQNQPIYQAKLLSGELPVEVEDLFAKYHQTLMPNDPKELSSECNCPDWANPCKHIAAVYYLISVELERDPFLFLRLRGIDVRSLSKRTPKKQNPLLEVEPLPADPVEFWKSNRILIQDKEVKRILGNASLVKQLGPFPLWRGEADFVRTMEEIYEKATEKALELCGTGVSARLFKKG